MYQCDGMWAGIILSTSASSIGCQYFKFHHQVISLGACLFCGTAQTCPQRFDKLQSTNYASSHTVGFLEQSPWMSSPSWSLACCCSLSRSNTAVGWKGRARRTPLLSSSASNTRIFLNPLGYYCGSEIFLSWLADDDLFWQFIKYNFKKQLISTVSVHFFMARSYSALSSKPQVSQRHAQNVLRHKYHEVYANGNFHQVTHKQELDICFSAS